MKKFLPIMLSLIILSGCGGNLKANTQSDNGIKIILAGEQLSFEKYFPYIDDNKVLQFPLDYVATAFNMNVNWDNERLTAFISKDNKKISVRIGDNNLIMDGKTIAMKSIVYEINGEVFVPIESILKVFDYETSWDGENKKLEIKNPQDKMAMGNKTFEFACKLADKFGSDYVFSPISIKLALAMLANGTENDALNQIKNALGIKNLDEYNSYVEKYLSGIKNGDDFKIKFGNSIWLNDENANANIKEDFVSQIDKYFGGFVSKVKNENAVDLINNWVMEHTENKIQNAISSPDFLLSLINTVYFSGQWEKPFDEANNLRDNFKCKNGAEKEIEFMQTKDHYFYYEGDNYKIISLPYKHSDVSMYIVLPKTENFSLGQVKFDNLERKYVQLRLPKFKKEFRAGDNLKNILMGMGIEKIFTGFSSNKILNGSDKQNVKCDNIVHDAFINLDEYGTEAAAATLIMINKMALPIGNEMLEFYADRPFKYIVRDNSNGEIIFVGDFSSIE